MNRITNATFVLSLLAYGGAWAMNGDVAAPFRGAWVPAKATCDSPLKLVIDASVVTFVNGAQRAEFRKLEQCYSCMGRDVQDVTLLTTEAMGDSPFSIIMDARKKSRPTLSVALDNDKKFGARFPLGTAALKKCP